MQLWHGVPERMKSHLTLRDLQEWHACDARGLSEFSALRSAGAGCRLAAMSEGAE